MLHDLKDKANHVFQSLVVMCDILLLKLVKLFSDNMTSPELKSKRKILC